MARLTRRESAVVAAVLLSGVIALVAGWLSGAAFAIVLLLALQIGTLLAVAVLGLHLRRRQAAHVDDLMRASREQGDRSAALIGSLSRQVQQPVKAPAKAPAPRTASPVVQGYMGVSRRLGLSRFASFAVQTRSDRALDVLAGVATDGAWTWLQLREAVRLAQAAPGSPLDTQVRTMTTRYPLVVLGRSLADRALSPDDSLDAARVLQLVRRHHGNDALTETDKTLLVEAYVDTGRAARAEQVLTELGLDALMPVQAQLFWANLSNPWRAPSVDRAGAQDETTWLDHANRALQVDALEPVALRPTGRSPFDRLQSEVASDVTGPLVSIIMPTHNPGDELDTAVRSVLGQTWSNLEILIVDDGSDSSSRERMHALAGADRRVRVLRQDENAGAYMARNRGLAEARGEFVTVHDDDDWSHPRKVERQVGYLLEHVEQVACLSWQTRATERLAFVRINHLPGYVQPNFSALMFRRERVLSRIGYWESSPRNADAEFRHRIEAMTGQAVPLVGDAPTSFLRTGVPSLTAGHLWRGYLDDRRRLYAWSYRTWHAQGPKRLSRDSPAPFPVPAGLATSTPLGTFDLVVATDLRFPASSPVLQQVETEVSAALASGMKVGLMHVHAPDNIGLATLGPAVARMVAEGAHVLSVRDEVVCSLLVVRHPPSAQFLDGTTATARADAVVLVADVPVLNPRTGDVAYEPRACLDNLEAAFAVRPVVVADSDLVHAQLAHLLDPEDVAERLWPVPLVTTQPHEPRRGHGTRDPVLGRDSRGDPEEWPTDADAFAKAYGTGSMRLLGSPAVPADRFGDEAVRDWEVSDWSQQNLRDFVRGLDFWVYTPSDASLDSLLTGPVEAMASGCVVILPPSMRQVYGEAALYGHAHDVPRLVHELWSDAQRYRTRSLLARRLVVDRFGKESYLATIRHLSATPAG